MQECEMQNPWVFRLTGLRALCKSLCFSVRFLSDKKKTKTKKLDFYVCNTSNMREMLEGFLKGILFWGQNKALKDLLMNVFGVWRTWKWSLKLLFWVCIFSNRCKSVHVTKAIVIKLTDNTCYVNYTHLHVIGMMVNVNWNLFEYCPFISN